MKWVNGETYQSKIERHYQWHRWFAWYPITIGEITIGVKTRKTKVWLQYVMRRDNRAFHMTYGFPEIEYKEV